MNQLEAANTTESYLCDVCSALDLHVESFIVSPNEKEIVKNAKIQHVKYLGLLSKIRLKTHCPLCRLVLDIADRPFDQRVPTLHAEENPIVWARWVIDGQDDLGRNEVTGQHMFLPRTRRLLIYSEPQAFKDGYLVLLGEDAPTPTFFGRHVSSPDLLDVDVVKGWIRDCEEYHGEECNDSLVHPDLYGDRRATFRAIDVEEMCIATPPPDARYLALSYLWGKGLSQPFTNSENLPRLSVPGALSKEKLPKTVRDSIRLTKMLGERYLWTDALALVHDSGFKYHDDWVYARAFLTVVAGSGKDANAGLPGVRKESRVFHQEIEQVSPGLRLMVSHLAEDYISTSQWDSRAWTFQERMLSRRCLLFVNGRIYYQCRRTTFCEDIDIPPTGWSLDSIDMPTRIFKERAFVQYTSAVELYSRRELTNPDDILNAFEGVEQVLEKRLNSSIFMGVLETEMDASLIWESSKKLKKRKPHLFPSWSWCGWLGEIQWKYADEVESWIDWHAASSSTNHKFPEQSKPRCEPPIPFPESEPDLSLRDPTLPDHVLRFKTISCHFKLSAAELIHKSLISPLRKRMTGPSALSTVRPSPADPSLIRAGIYDRNGQWCGTIHLDEWWLCQVGRPLEFLLMSKVDAFTEDELALWRGILPDVIEEVVERPQGIDPEDWHPTYGVYNVLLVIQHAGRYYRQGLGRIMASALLHSLEPGPVWKDIVLG